MTTKHPIHDALKAALADHYRLERELGAGGMATVYLAEDLKHHRKVAVKVLRPELAATIGSERFLREITLTAQFDHPNILPLLDSGEAAGAVFYVMPFVDGESLRDRLMRQKQLPLDEAFRITEQVADALGYAHARQVIHRDIKPENILLSAGHARVADFGIARAFTEAGGERLTETGLAIGTPAYMSPEQSMGERDLDGRTDLYALGCVLYEMLAGEPPYTGPTAQAIITKRITLPVPSVRVLRDTVPESVDRALSRAMAKSPTDRFTTAKELVAALQHPGDHATTLIPVAPARRAPLLRWVTAAVIVAVAGVGLVRWWPFRTTTLDPNLLAIAPLDVTDPSLAVWREGVVDLLTRTLDGAGVLRTVSPSVVLRKWEGHSDQASATIMAHRTGAGLASIGTLSRRGADSVEIRAAVLDIEHHRVIGELSVAGTTDRVGALVDSLGLEILRTLSRVRPIAAVRQATLGSAPLPALKAYLRGEQFFRGGQYDSALTAYNEAIQGDTTFALAYGRMGEMLSWNPPTAGLYKEQAFYNDRAMAHAHGLGVRDSLLFANQRAAAAERFPADPEVWYHLGEQLYHNLDGSGQDPTRALQAFDRSIALDSGFGPAYEHVMGLAVDGGQYDRAVEYARAAATLKTADDMAFNVGFASRLLLWTPTDGVRRRDQLMDSASTMALFRAGMEIFAQWPDSAETAVEIMRRFQQRQIGKGEIPEWHRDPLMRAHYLAMVLAYRGHLRQAMEVDRALIANPAASPFGEFWPDPVLPLALSGVIGDDRAAANFREPLTRSAPPSPEVGLRARHFSGLPWLAMKGDTTAIKLFRRRVDQAPDESVGKVTRTPYLHATADGYLALLRGDSARAEHYFSTIPNCSIFEICIYEKLQLAQLLSARGKDAEAAKVLDQWAPGAMVPAVTLAWLERARIAERLQDRDTARRWYQYVVDIWRNADPELQPYVTEAKAGLSRVAGEK